jgi:hypothetical protein
MNMRNGIIITLLLPLGHISKIIDKHEQIQRPSSQGGRPSLPMALELGLLDLLQ